MLRLRRKAGQRLDDAQAFERERERAFRQAERELRQFQRNLGRITDERRIARLEADLEELERAVEAARQAWLLARAQTQQTSEITNDIRERINFTKQVMAVWDTAAPEDQRTVVDCGPTPAGPRGSRCRTS
jgi:archaellum component FlaC